MGLFSGPILGNGGIFGGGDPGTPEGDQRMAMMAQLLAGGGYSPQRQSFGQIMGQALMAGQLARQQAVKSRQAQEAADLDKQYRQAQIEKMNRPTDELGQYQPGDYTPESWAKFIAGGQKDPGVLVRYEAPRQMSSKPFQQVTRTLPDGSTELGVMDARTGEYTWTGAIVPAGKKAFVEAQARAEGEAAGGQSAKAPAAQSFDIALSNMRQSIGNTGTGGLLGVRGAAESVIDKSAADTFDSRVQQLSTELRTVFRIPGEGALSDQEQAQYGLQLPKRSFNADTNEQIVKDLEARVRARLQTPISQGGGGGASPGAKRRRFNPATGKIE